MATKKPDFLVIGAQKCGTTMLHQVLSGHRDVFMPGLKEIHYFDREVAYPDHMWYGSHFVDAGNRICGEATPAYCFWPGAIERIVEALPEVKVVMLLRDPVERAISHHAMEYGRGMEALSLEDAIEAESSRLMTGGAHALRHHSYVARGRYCGQLGHIRGLMGPRRVAVLSLEKVISDARGCFTGLANFLGLDPDGFPSTAPVVFPATRRPNVGPRARQLLHERLSEECGTWRDLVTI